MTNHDTAALARSIATTAIDRLATDVKLLDLRGVVSYTDWFVIYTGSNTRQTKAIAEHIVTEIHKAGHGRPRRRETDPEGTWLLLDYVDVVVYVFTPESREFYRLESLWGQVPQETVVDPKAAAGSDADRESRPMSGRS